MQVFPYAGARGLSLVEANIDAFAMKMLFKDFRAGFQKIHQLPAFLRGQVLKLHDVPVWTDHDVAIVVWIFVHDRKTVPATVKHKSFGVLVRFGRDAEHTFIGFWPKDVTYAPRCPKLFHDKQSYTHASRPASVDLRARGIFWAVFDTWQHKNPGSKYPDMRFSPASSLVVPDLGRQAGQARTPRSRAGYQTRAQNAKP
jgi:hypothetical protein